MPFFPAPLPWVFGMTSVTLAKLRSRVRERVDMVGSSFITDVDTSLDAWINEGHQKLHGMLVDAFGEEYVYEEYSVTTVAGTTDYSVPSGFFKLYGIDLGNGSDWRALKQFNRAERNTYRNSQYTNDYLPRYRLLGTDVRISPAPPAGQTLAIIYAPEASNLSEATDTVSYPNGWERFIVIDAAIQAVIKEESSPTALLRERELVMAEIERTKDSRDMASPGQIVDLDMVDREFW